MLGLFLVFSSSHLIPGPAASPSLRVLFDWYDERVRDVPVRSTSVGPQNAPEVPPLPLGKG